VLGSGVLSLLLGLLIWNQWPVVGDVGGRCAGGRRSSFHWYFNGGAGIACNLGPKTDDCKTKASMEFGYLEVAFYARIIVSGDEDNALQDMIETRKRGLIGIAETHNVCPRHKGAWAFSF